MNKLKELIGIFITITLGILVIKFMIWLLPVIILGLIIYCIYISIKKNKKNTKKTNKKIKIIDMEEDNN